MRTLSLYGAQLAAPARKKDASTLDSTGFRRVFDDHAPYVARMLRYLGVHEAHVDDLCQEIFIVLFRKADLLDFDSGLTAYVRQVCIRTVGAYRRKMRRRRDHPRHELPPIAVDPNQTAGLEHREARAVLNGLLDRLTDKKRAVFVLYEIERVPMEEIAKIVGCPLQTAYSRLREARKQLASDASRLNIEGGG